MRFVGRIEAIERVDIRARVIGYLEDVLFKDGESGQDRQRLCITSRKVRSKQLCSRQKPRCCARRRNSTMP